MTLKVVVTGARGFLGKKICAVFRARGAEVVPTDLPELDLTNEKAVAALLAREKPGVVVHAAAFTDVDACETQREKAFAANVSATENVARACKKAGARLALISTDFIFDGEKQGAYTEEDAPNPLNYYAYTKAEAEKAVLRLLPAALIVRTGVLYGFNDANDKATFANWALKKLGEGAPFKVVDDQFAQPTLADDLAEAVYALLEKNARGVFNATGSEYLNRFEFVREVAEAFGFDPALAKPMKTPDLHQKAARPMKLKTSHDKLNRLGIRMSDTREGLRKMKRQMGDAKGRGNSWPAASVIIPAFNNREGLRKVVRAMLELDYPADYEVIVVNDGSSDGTKEMLDKEFGGEEKMRLIHLPRSGVCKARNAGIRQAKGEIVVNMDHDCVPGREWLKRMAEGFNDPKTGVVTGYGGYGGTSTGFRRELLRRVGGYDEDYFYYREDTDLAFRILELGHELKQVDAPYHHDHAVERPKSFLDAISYGLKRIGWHKNDVLLWKKHPNKRCAEFLHVKLGFLVDPRYDFGMATGTWEGGGKFRLSSPRGLVFLENRSPLHALAIVLMGLAYVAAVKLVRLYGSLKFGRLLL